MKQAVFRAACFFADTQKTAGTQRKAADVNSDGELTHSTA